jgi:hypothetical protein
MEHRALSLTASEVRLIEETLEHARDTVPVMMGRVLDAILAQLLWYRIRTHHTDEELEATLADERAGDLVPDTKPIRLPGTFANAFRQRLFAVVYTRLFRNLPDRKLIPEAASEVFVDFVVRLMDEADAGAAYTFSDPRHDEFLRTLCDRTVARLIGHSSGTFVAIDEGEVPIQGLKKTGLYDAVLKEVGDRVARLNG